MPVESVNSSYTPPPPAPEPSAPQPSVEEVPVSEAPVEAPNTSVNIDIIA